jgi:hypothetical protein
VITELVYALRHIEASESEPVVEAPPTEGRITPSLPVQPSPKSQIAQKTLAGIPFALESIGGAVPLNSEFYLQRPADTELRSALDRADSIILIKGARQMGKTSLLARGLQYAREQGTHTAVTDLQKFNAINLLNANNFYLTLAESLVDQLDLPIIPSTLWDPRRSPNMNFERFIRREILGKISGRLVWGLDEVDRLFGCAFGSEVFGLFRSWHNERALDPMGPWSKFTFVITYATEAHLFITDLNQSPFNVGTRIELEDFTPAQISELNHRYHSPIKDEDKVARFTRLLSGHPYLVRRGLHELSGFESSYDDFELHAARDEGIYGDHLRRILVLLAKDKSLENVVRAVLVGEGCPTKEFFYRLRSAGIISGTAPTDARMRCRLYSMFLKRHLLNSGSD